MTDLIESLNHALTGRYRIQSKLGSGGMATVYLAEDLRHPRQVAIKVLRDELYTELAADRFHREIEVAASLSHPLILPLYTSGEVGGFLFYVMPFVEGESLADRLSSEPQLPIPEALDITREVAEALAYAHEHGVVHRDIKPGNILFSGGHAVLADFGIAQAISLAGGKTLTSSGIAVGTPRYMSPEQAGGDVRVDGRSDLYSLGCVLHEMLAGEPPFQGARVQSLVAQQLSAAPTPVRVFRSSVPEWLEAVVLRCLEKSPADRYQTAADLSAALDATRQADRVRRRKRFRTAALLTVLTLAVSLAVLRFAFTGGEGLVSPNRIVVFPPAELGNSVSQQGEQVAIIVGYTLEDTEPLRWLEGRDRLSVEQRRDPTVVSVRQKRAISRREGARYFIDGSIIQSADSASVILRLHDVEDETVVARAGASGPLAGVSFGRLGIRAVSGLLPSLIERGRSVDTTALAERHPAAVANWLLGEVDYRRSRFDDALSHFARALDQDAALAHAALGGAKAAMWKELEEASTWIEKALAYEGSLPERHTRFARGLESYLNGDAESAIRFLEGALDERPAWSEPWMALGEVYRHLLPDALAFDSLAEAAYRKALEYDSEFSAPLAHLAEYALRRRELDRARELLDRYSSFEPESRFVAYLQLAERCLREGAGAMRWHEAAATEPFVVVQAGIALAGSLRDTPCAEGAYRAAHEAESATPQDEWGALVGLQTLLVAHGRHGEVPPLLDSNAFGFLLYSFDVAAGAPFGEGAESAATKIGRDHAANFSPVLWSLGLWAAQADSLGLLREIIEELEARRDSTGRRVDALIAAQLSAQAAIAEGDTALAVGLLRSLSPSAGKRNLLWDPWESLGVDRLALGELLLARGSYREVDSLMALFDHPQPIAYVALRPAALALRAEAAEALGDPERAALYRGQREAIRP